MLYMNEKCRYFFVPESVFITQFVTCGEDAYVANSDDVKQVYRLLNERYRPQYFLPWLKQLGYVPYVIGQYRLRIYDDKPQDRPLLDISSEVIILEQPEDR